MSKVHIHVHAPRRTRDAGETIAQRKQRLLSHHQPIYDKLEKMRGKAYDRHGPSKDPHGYIEAGAKDPAYRALHDAYWAYGGWMQRLNVKNHSTGSLDEIEQALSRREADAKSVMQKYGSDL